MASMAMCNRTSGEHRLVRTYKDAEVALDRGGGPSEEEETGDSDGSSNDHVWLAGWSAMQSFVGHAGGAARRCMSFLLINARRHGHGIRSSGCRISR